MKRMISLVLSGAAGMLVFTVSLVSADPPVEGVFTHPVYVQDNLYDPVSVSIRAGEQVKWSWVCVYCQHSVTAEDGSFDSGIQNLPYDFYRVFNTPGTYYYYCTNHGVPGAYGGAYMNGRVVVGPA